MPTLPHIVRPLVLSLVASAGIVSGCSGDPPAEGGRPASTSTASTASAPAPAAEGFTIESLGVETGSGWALEINDRGQVTGYASGGFWWDRASGLVPIGEDPETGTGQQGTDAPAQPPSADLIPSSINAQGLVAGVRAPDEETSEPFLWEPETGVRTVDEPDDWTDFVVIALTDAGRFAGTAVNGFVDYEGSSEAYLWDPSVGWTGLGRPSEAQDLNEAGQVLVSIGGIDTPYDDQRLYLWAPGADPRHIGQGHAGRLNDSGQVAYSAQQDDCDDCWDDLIRFWDPATGRSTEVAVGEAFDINGSGQVVGRVIDDDISRAFVWDAEDGLTDLGVLPGAEWSVAQAVNDRGQVVGSSGTGSWGAGYGEGIGSSHAFVWDARTGMRDLGGDADFAAAVGINDSGQIVGWSGLGAADGEPTMAVSVWTPEQE